MMKKNKNSTDFTPTVVAINNMIVEKYGVTARITRIWEFLLDIMSKTEFDMMDIKDVNPLFESWLVNTLIDWNNGKEVDFSEIRDSILKAGTFSAKEKYLLNQEEVNYMLWGIYTAITNPGEKLTLNNTSKNDRS
jgi:hypothetical protein